PAEPGYFTSLPIAPVTTEATAPFNADGQGFIGQKFGVPERLLGQGDPAPGTGLGFQIDFVDMPQASADGAVALRASVGDLTERFDRQQSVWRRDGGSMDLVAWADPREPGAGEILFTDFGVEPWAGPGGETVFWASVRGDTVTELNDAAIWSDDGSGAAALLREGDPAPG